MDRYVLDVNVVLDYYDELRMVKYPDSVRVFEYIRDRGTGFISSSSLDNIAFLKTRDLMVDKNLTFNDAKKVCKYMLKEILSFFKIAKTPSYLALDYENIEDSQLIASAKAIGAKIVTRDSKLIEDFPEMTIHPKDFFGYLEGKKIHISMLDITKQTFNIYEKIEENMDKVIVKSNFILGEEVKILENKIANYIGTKHAVAVSSGTDALLISLRALAIKRKNKEYWDREDLIITTPFTFTATGDTILRSGATPLFVDIDLQTYNIDPVQIREAFKKYGKKVVGIVPVHLYGLPCDMDEIKELSDENDIFIVEDCAQAFGSKYKGKKVGSFGDTGCFSFFPSKNLGAFGDAGAITTDDDELVEIIRMLRVHGGKDKYNVE
ncbi:MAG: DegT/DnrJ/EryC1/StrS family aminotransferase, partial [Thermodesulfovibrio sp.]|nr:DegT/DnrJ/EryC1/StrS family aminotransferase [Thermodesulfovibrio sp.]